jgi:AP-1 complex subunit beta-1
MYPIFPFHNYHHAQHNISLDDGISPTQKALQNIAAGQQAENLLDFGDDELRDGQPSGLAATTISATPAAPAYCKIPATH